MEVSKFKMVSKTSSLTVTRGKKCSYILKLFGLAYVYQFQSSSALLLTLEFFLPGIGFFCHVLDLFAMCWIFLPHF